MRAARLAAVIDPLPSVRRGLESAFTASGWQVLPAPDPTAAGDLILIAAVEQPDVTAAIDRWRADHPQLRLVATVSSRERHAAAAALTAGAAAVLPRDAEPEDVVRAAELALADLATVPWQVLTALRPAPDNSRLAEALTPEDIRILRLLAEGATVAIVCREIAVAERTVYRRLERLYDTLGVSSRVQALATAFRAGLLEP